MKKKNAEAKTSAANGDVEAPKKRGRKPKGSAPVVNGTPLEGEAMPGVPS